MITSDILKLANKFHDKIKRQEETERQEIFNILALIRNRTNKLYGNDLIALKNYLFKIFEY